MKAHRLIAWMWDNELQSFVIYTSWNTKASLADCPEMLLEGWYRSKKRQNHQQYTWRYCNVTFPPPGRGSKTGFVMGWAQSRECGSMLLVSVHDQTRIEPSTPPELLFTSSKRQLFSVLTSDSALHSPRIVRVTTPSKDATYVSSPRPQVKSQFHSFSVSKNKWETIS